MAAIRPLSFFMCAALLVAASGDVLADVFKCTENGVVRYMDRPCYAGSQRAIDARARQTEKIRRDQQLELEKSMAIMEADTSSRSKLIQEEYKAAREKFAQLDAENIGKLKACQKAGCSADEYSSLLLGRPIGLVTSSLGCEIDDSTKVTRTLCPVQLVNDNQTTSVKLQLEKGHAANLPAGVINGDRVNQVKLR